MMDMSDDYVLIPYGDDASDTATLLLSAAEDKGYDPVFAVKHQPDDGGFRVPADVAEAAGLGEPDEPETEVEDPDDQEQAKPAPKKAAKKTTAKKAAAKKTTAKG